MKYFKADLIILIGNLIAGIMLIAAGGITTYSFTLELLLVALYGMEFLAYEHMYYALKEKTDIDKS